MSETQAWRALAQRGHELGNHSCFHPCRKGSDKQWLEDGYDLKTYSSRRWCEEMRAANFTLSLIDGLDPTQRSFGNTCNDTIIGPDENPTVLDPYIEELFVAGRGGGAERSINVHQAINMNNLGNRVFDLLPRAQCIAHLEQAILAQHWQIVEIHGVGSGSHNLFVTQDDHLAICQYLADHPQVWVAPVREIAAYVRSQIQAAD